MIKHIVMWNLKDDLDVASTRDKIKSTLESLVEKVESLKVAEVGFNHNPTDAARDISLYTEFEDQAGLEAMSFIQHTLKLLVM